MTIVKVGGASGVGAGFLTLTLLSMRGCIVLGLSSSSLWEALGFIPSTTKKTIYGCSLELPKGKEDREILPEFSIQTWVSGKNTWDAFVFPLRSLKFQARI